MLTRRVSCRGCCVFSCLGCKGTGLGGKFGVASISPRTPSTTYPLSAAVGKAERAVSFGEEGMMAAERNGEKKEM